MKDWVFSSFVWGGGGLGFFKLVWVFSELIFILDRLFLCSILRSCTRKFCILFFWFMGKVFVGFSSFLISNSPTVSHRITRIFLIYMRDQLELQCKELYYIRERRNRPMEDNHLSDSRAISIWEQQVWSKRSLQLKIFYSLQWDQSQTAEYNRYLLAVTVQISAWTLVACPDFLALCWWLHTPM